MAERELERDLLASSAEGSAVETEQLREEIKQALTRLTQLWSHTTTRMKPCNPSLKRLAVRGSALF